MVPAIEFERVSKRYDTLRALTDVTFQIAPGEFFGLLGPNGAGKTTLINILAGLARVSGGSARVMGFDVLTRYREARRSLGVVPQELVFDPFFTVREALSFQSGYFGIRDNRDWIEEVMYHLDLAGKAETNMRSLSGGMKRRVLVAQALVHKPPVIVLDEPTAGVDVELRQALWRFVKRLNRDGHTIVLTTHYLEEAEALCERIAMLKQGRVVALDTTQNLLRMHSGCYVALRLIPDQLPEALAPFVTERDERGYWLALPAYTEVERVMAELRNARVEIQEMEVMQPDLEEIFVQIMSRH
ncbi:MAG: ABC transporter ATP-binding protein [Betaproteobacteria bacterium]|nr:ABC transporter ATP-binding protein [Betaproteobacteria bacterium]MDH3435584.1 ABC transporter ATP-binding protein [Betaproteobacteria bacterium]